MDIKCILYHFLSLMICMHEGQGVESEFSLKTINMQSEIEKKYKKKDNKTQLIFHLNMKRKCQKFIISFILI